MRFFAGSASILLVFTCANASPFPDAKGATALAARQDSNGSYTVPGLGVRKQAILGAGGNTLDLAIAMLETDDMGTDYPYGDSKTGDSANFGVFKQNWYMLRTAAYRYGFQGQTESEWNNGAELNSNLYADVASRWDDQGYYGYDAWFGGQRDGELGINNPYTADITNYKNAVEWIQQQIDSNSVYQSDDTRFWVEIPAI